MCFFFASYYPRHKPLDFGAFTISKSEDKEMQDLYCFNSIIKVNTTVPESMPEYVAPGRAVC